MLEKIAKFIDYNRFIVILPLVAVFVWLCAVGCEPLTKSPTTGELVNKEQLALDLAEYQADQELVVARFDLAAKDIEKQEQANSKIENLLLELASGNVVDLPGFLKLIIGGGLLGAISDNIRKRGLIAGLKRNKTE